MFLNIDIRSLEILYERDLDSCCSSIPNKVADFGSTFAVLVVYIALRQAQVLQIGTSK